MVLSDRSIREELAAGRLRVEPFEEANLQPASIDVRLDRQFRVFHAGHRPFIDVRQRMDEVTEPVDIADDEPFYLMPGEFALASTLEEVSLPDDLVAQVEGRSSLGRLGLLIHATAGFIDPGFHGKLTLELSNVAKMPIALYYGMKIGQIAFLRLSTPAERLYGDPALGSKYQGQTGPAASRAYLDFPENKPQ